MTRQAARETTSGALDFEFFLPEGALLNRSTQKVSHVRINFESTPTGADTVDIFYSGGEGDDAVADLIESLPAASESHLRFSPATPIPIPNDAKLIVRYANTNSVEVSVLILWQI